MISFTLMSPWVVQTLMGLPMILTSIWQIYKAISYLVLIEIILVAIQLKYYLLM